MKPKTKTLVAALTLAVSGLAAGQALAGQTNVAVAANFTGAAKEIARAFEETTGHEAILSFGSTGKLYTQITQDAPFEVFLAADAARPEKLTEEGLAVTGSRFTYAIGKLVLWSKDPAAVTGEDTLKTADFEKISICNPVAAPYGAAAVETMKALDVYDALKPRFVEGANVTQAHQFVETGNAEVGFVALSQVIDDDSGSRWEVPQEFYEPIRQDAVLLNKGADSEAAAAFMAFLKQPEARSIIVKFGYAFDPAS